MVSSYNCHKRKGLLNAVSTVQFFSINLAAKAGVLGVVVLSGFLLKVLCGLIQLYIKTTTANRASRCGISLAKVCDFLLK